MRFKKPLFLAALATCTVVFSDGAIAASDPTVYAFHDPNRYVEYLVLNQAGNRVSGYFQIDARSQESATGETRTRLAISQTVVGSRFTFDKYTVVRNADGYTLASVSRDGQVSEQHLVRTTANAVNASLRTLAVNIRRSRAQSAMNAATSELRGRGAAGQTSTLARAQVRLDSAVVTARDLQIKADSLWQAANGLRAVADAQMESPGVSVERNAQLANAMENADQAERKARFAQRLATLANTDVTTQETDVVAIHKRIAVLQERIEASAAILKSTGDLADR